MRGLWVFRFRTIIGIAAHMTAAASGGPRYKEDITHEQRKNNDNAGAPGA
jgi:hypothetical protein